jgi:predicted transcriptional regulator
MRTTLHIDDDVYQAAKSIAETEGRSVGKVLSSLARKGLAPREYRAEETGIPVFVVSENVAPLTLEMVKKAMEEE